MKFSYLFPGTLHDGDCVLCASYAYSEWLNLNHSPMIFASMFIEFSKFNQFFTQSGLDFAP